MSAPIERIVDAHIHLWDPARADWYPYLAGQRELDMGDISGMCRLFDQPTYFSESANWNVVKFVHVAAATAPYSGDGDARSSSELAEATGHPDAIIGGIVPTTPSPTPSGCSTSRWSRPGSAASGRWAAGSASRAPTSCARSPSATWSSS